MHSRTDLDPMSKFTYLHTVLRGQAGKLVENYSISAGNCKSATDLLITSYNVPGRNIKEVTCRFLKSPNHNSKDLIQFRAEVEAHLRFLEEVEALGCDVQASSWTVVMLLAKNLTPRTVELVNLKAGMDHHNVNQFREALG